MIKNMLVIRNDRFGEFLLNIPAMRALKESYPQAKLTLAVNPLVKELAQAIECVDAVAIWDDKFRKGMRKQKFDLCVVLNPTKEAHWAVFWAGIPARIGYNRKWGILLTHKLKDTKHLGNRHEVDCNLELVGLVENKVTVTKGVTVTLITVPRNDKYEFLAGAIAIHPYTSDALKQWPVERFSELAWRITQEMKVKVVLVGNTEEWGQSPFGDSPHSGTVPSEIIDLINKTSLVELAQILKQCKLMITCDSGPMHLAAAVGTPVIALFRNDLPGKTAKRWGPWGKGHIVLEKPDLHDISVDEVFEKARMTALNNSLDKKYI